MDTWCPRFKAGGFGDPSFYVVCFHNAGASDAVYADPKGPLVEWAKQAGGAVLAPQLAGRESRHRDAPATDMRAVAAELAPVLLPALKEKPYYLLAHSMGTWLLVEIQKCLAAAGLTPAGVVVSGFPPPTAPLDARPWPRTDGLGDADFQAAVRAWDPEHFEGPAQAIFRPGTWDDFSRYMRADFTLFETYAPSEPVSLGAPLLVITAESDKLIPEELTRGWEACASDVAFKTVPGGHNQVMFAPALKKQWLAAATDFFDAQLEFADLGF